MLVLSGAQCQSCFLLSQLNLTPGSALQCMQRSACLYFLLMQIPAPIMQELKASSPNATGQVNEIVGPVSSLGPASQASPLQTTIKSKRTGQVLQESLPGPDATPMFVLKEMPTRRALAASARKGSHADLNDGLTDSKLYTRDKRLRSGSSPNSPQKGPRARQRKENVPPDHIPAPMTLLSGTQQNELGTSCASPEAAEATPTQPWGQDPLRPNKGDVPGSSLNPASGGSSNGHHSALTSSQSGGTATAGQGRTPFSMRNSPSNLALPPKKHGSGTWIGGLPTGQNWQNSSSVSGAMHQAKGKQTAITINMAKPRV